MKIDKSDYIGIGLAYLGTFFMCFWGIWSINKYNIAFADMSGFIRVILGI